MSALSAFTTQLVSFFGELCNTFPEEKDIKMATEAIVGAKKINPRLLFDLFIEHVYKDLGFAILNRDMAYINIGIQWEIKTKKLFGNI